MGRSAGMLALLGLWTFVAAVQGAAEPKSSLYIVHMDKSTVAVQNVDDVLDYKSIYSSLLRSVKVESETFSAEDDDDKQAHLPVHIYQHALHGFSAQLKDAEVEVLKKKPGVLGVHRDQVRHVQTTHTPEFLGLNEMKGLWPASHFGRDVIVGVLDTGIWPESESFNDEGLGPVPARWKGTCQTSKDFKGCNKKLIGARYYSTGYEIIWGKMNETLESRSPRDMEGHGSHTASTAAGSPVQNANLFGFANGTARGMAYGARIATYKVCWQRGCMESDMAEAFDHAVADGVDIITISIGGSGGNVPPYYLDSIAIGAFGAMSKGVFVSAAGGNSGPKPETLSNLAPWITTVAASTVDRRFPASVYLGNMSAFAGESLYRYNGNPDDEKIHDLVHAGDVAITPLAKNDSAQCLPLAMNPALVKGKIVVCERGAGGRIAKGVAVKNAGGAGMVLINDEPNGESLNSDPHALPATQVGLKAGALIKEYINSTKQPVARLKFGHFSGTRLGEKHAPAVAAFSSRGPNVLNPDVIKPDLMAPGVDILAAWTGNQGPTEDVNEAKVPFNIISGTSMACPHVGGLAALLKGAHPDWSPSAIKSALMTTATIFDNTGNIISTEENMRVGTPYDFGSGFVQPERALDPGLVYDMGVKDYVTFMCAMYFTADQIKMFTGSDAFPCTPDVPMVGDMNYPSFSTFYDISYNKLVDEMPRSFKRTVTNVGDANSTYKAVIEAPENVHVDLHPKELKFSKVGEKKSFVLTVTGTKAFRDAAPASSFSTNFGYLKWIDGKHVVQSPIAVSLHKGP